MINILAGLVLILSIYLFDRIIMDFIKYEEEKKMNKHQKYILDSSIQINVGDIINEFDYFITLSIQEHLQLNVDYKGIEYINNELEEELIRTISKNVFNNISQTLINKISLIYRIENEEDLADLIAKKTYLQLLGYIREMNSIKNNNEIPNINLINKK